MAKEQQDVEDAAPPSQPPPQPQQSSPPSAAATPGQPRLIVVTDATSPSAAAGQPLSPTSLVHGQTSPPRLAKDKGTRLSKLTRDSSVPVMDKPRRQTSSRFHVNQRVELEVLPSLNGSFLFFSVMRAC